MQGLLSIRNGQLVTYKYCEVNLKYRLDTVFGVRDIHGKKIDKIHKRTFNGGKFMEGSR